MNEKNSTTDRIEETLDDYFNVYENDIENTVSVCIESILANSQLSKSLITNPILNLLALQKLIKQLHEQRTNN